MEKDDDEEINDEDSKEEQTDETEEVLNFRQEALEKIIPTLSKIETPQSLEEQISNTNITKVDNDNSNIYEIPTQKSSYSESSDYQTIAGDYSIPTNQTNNLNPNSDNFRQDKFTSPDSLQSNIQQQNYEPNKNKDKKNIW